MTLPLLGPKRVLPLLIFMAVLMVGFRLNDIWENLTEPTKIHAVQTASATESKAAAPKAAEKPVAKESPSIAAETPPAPPEQQRYASDPTSMSTMDIAKQLAARRDSLEKREQDINAREALTKVAEQRIDQKLKEMETLRTQLQGMVNTLGATQQTQLENLVKIYEIMKPKEAAHIFETLELPVLLGVIERMKPARTAAVMAEMDPQRAKEITVALTKQDQLPKVK